MAGRGMVWYRRGGVGYGYGMSGRGKVWQLWVGYGSVGVGKGEVGYDM